MLRKSARSSRPGGNPLDGGVAVVTGGGKGIGECTAMALHRRGCSVAVLDIDVENAQRVAAEIQREGGTAEAWEADVTNREQLQAVTDEIVSSLGEPTVLINNAGVGVTGSFGDTEPDDWEWIRSINLDGVVNGCYVVGNRMLERGFGHIVNLSSGLAYNPRATEIHYCTTKAAVLTFSRCLRSDWEPRGVGVSVICPGVINTTIASTGRHRGDRAEEENMRQMKKLFSMGHKPEKVADAIIDAIDDGKGIVGVGWESRLTWHLNRFVPDALQVRISRFDPQLPI